jgi:hypothetical protein
LGALAVLVGPAATFSGYLVYRIFLSPYDQRNEARAAAEWWERRGHHGHSTSTEVKESLEEALTQAEGLRTRLSACSTMAEFFDVFQECEVLDNRAGFHLEHFYGPYRKRWSAAGDHFMFIEPLNVSGAVTRLDAKVSCIKVILEELNGQP